MFSNPFTAVMALILLAFIGTLVIFFCVWRELDALRRTVQDMRSSMQFVALDMEQHTRDLAAILRELRQLTGGDAADLGALLEKGLPNLEQRFAAGTTGRNADSFCAERVAMHSFAQEMPSSTIGSCEPRVAYSENAEFSTSTMPMNTGATQDDSLAPLRFDANDEEEALLGAIRGNMPKF